MSTLQRGSVVARAGQARVVWRAVAAGFVVFPVLFERPTYSTDVPVEDIRDRLAIRAIGDTIIRVGTILTVPNRDIQFLGTLSPSLQCKISQAAYRAASNWAAVQKWTSEKVHRERAFDERSALR